MSRTSSYASHTVVWLALVLLGPALMPAGLFAGVRDGCLRVADVSATAAEDFVIRQWRRGDGKPVFWRTAAGQTQSGPACGFDDAPMSLHGTTRLPADSPLWVVSTTTDGKHYLTPRVHIAGGDWVAADMRIGTNVRRLDLVRVDARVDQDYQARVARGDWGALPKAPDGASLATLTLEEAR